MRATRCNPWWYSPFAGGPTSVSAGGVLLVWATSERFPPARATFRSVLANKSQQLQPLLVLTVRWWPGTSKYGWAIRDGRGVGLFKNGSTLLTSKTGFAYENPKVFSFLPIHHHHHAAIACNYLSVPTGNLIHSSINHCNFVWFLGSH